MKPIRIQVAVLALACAASAPALAQENTTTPTDTHPINPNARTTGTDTLPIDADSHSIDSGTRPIDSGMRPIDSGTQTIGVDSRADEAESSAWVRAPRRAFELGINTGYTQGFGLLHGGTNAVNPADAGLGVGAELGYRINPKWSVQGYGQYNQFRANDTRSITTNVRSALFGVSATVHGMPYGRLDPWLSVGSGYRMLWQAPEGVNNDMLYHGFEFAKLQVGLDVRATKDIALGPVIGGDLNYFTWQKPELSVNSQMITDRRVTPFVFAGVQGRFDMGGNRQSRLAEKMVGKR